MKPIIFSVQNKAELKSKIIQLHPEKVFDIYKDLSKELYLNKNPKIYFSPKEHQKSKFDKHFKSYLKNSIPETKGKWVYFPWNKNLYHLLNKTPYYNLRTIRNQNLVNKDQQAKLHKTKIALAGLSVGKNTLLSLIRHGIGDQYNIADMDTFELSNINRALYDLSDYHQPKIISTQKNIYQIDPYLKINSFDKGIDDKNLSKFVKNVDIIIDTFDHFPTKIALRKIAKAKKIPILSGADLERGVFITIERYDTEKNLDLSFYLNNQSIKSLQSKSATKKEITDFFIKMIGKDLHSKTMLKSVYSVGESLTSYPQLIIASQLFASVITTLTEAIILNKPLKSIRKNLNLSKYFSIE